MHSIIKENILRLQGPILILGANGFVGANLFQYLLESGRKDIFGTTTQSSPWRLSDLPQNNIIVVDLLLDQQLVSLLTVTKPQTVFNCVAYGAYSFEEDADKIYKTNFGFIVTLVNLLRERNITRYIHAGSSSEYGDNAKGPKEDSELKPNSHYAVSKASAAALLCFMGKKNKFPCANLRLASVYGPFEDSARLIPVLVSKGLEGEYPEFVHPNISRDFIYIEDVCAAFVLAALHLKEENYGESFNIGTGIKTTISDVAAIAQKLFSIQAVPKFTMTNRSWDVEEWYSNPQKAQISFQLPPCMSFEDGLKKTVHWFQNLGDYKKYHTTSKKLKLSDKEYSISAIVACYKDNDAIPIMYNRLTKIFTKLNIHYEIIFINDCSPDNTEEVIRKLSETDKHVIGLTHSRNFGSQAAFRSGMEIAQKNAVVLLDGDLQDPPELIEQFLDKWREGYDVIYGRRVKREAPIYMQIFYKLFYRIFDLFSYISIPHDAGDFSLMEKKVVQSLLQFPERDLYVRGLRAFVGFKQTGVDYIRPERVFGTSTNNFFKNIGWAKKGILSFSNAPLNMLSFFSIALLGLTIILSLITIGFKIFSPEAATKGVTTTLLMIMFFGSINFLAVSIIGEYIRKILEEAKCRPHFIRNSVIKNGKINPYVSSV